MVEPRDHRRPRRGVREWARPAIEARLDLLAQDPLQAWRNGQLQAVLSALMFGYRAFDDDDSAEAPLPAELQFVNVDLYWLSCREQFEFEAEYLTMRAYVGHELGDAAVESVVGSVWADSEAEDPGLVVDLDPQGIVDQVEGLQVGWWLHWPEYSEFSDDECSAGERRWDWEVVATDIWGRSVSTGRIQRPVPE